MSVRVSSYMSAPVVTAHENDNLAHVRNLMLKYKIGRVVVLREENVGGIFTITDFVRVFTSQEKRWSYLPVNEILVKDVMTKNPIMIYQTKSVRLAAKTMTKYRISGLPAVDIEKRLKGIITKTNIVRAIPRTRSSKIRVEELMTREVITLSPSHTLFRAASVMAKHSISHVVVTEGKTPVGMISKSDLASYAPVNSGRSALERASGKGGYSKAYVVPLVADLMRDSLVTIEPANTLGRASEVMLEQGISSLPVVEGDSLVGIITKSDLVRAVAKFR
jgi:CBS domain-containing protein